MFPHRRLSRTKAAVAATLAIAAIAAVPSASSTPLYQKVAIPRVPTPEIPLIKMGIVPPHVHANMAKNPILNDNQRDSARKNLEKSQQVSEVRLEESLRPMVPVRVLERLAADVSIVCSDQARKELLAILDSSSSRWPHMPNVRVSEELRGVLDANPGLWEGGKTVEEKKTPETEAAKKDEKK